eukprot:GHVU01178831.1.p1 GENE.GHVU01178831.1~~GHVU01178831.1.p1  ORF type:complete len:510 (+),score=88.70 GHVU01178831.1:1725-3254(+)
MRLAAIMAHTPMRRKRRLLMYFVGLSVCLWSSWSVLLCTSFLVPSHAGYRCHHRNCRYNFGYDNSGYTPHLRIAPTVAAGLSRSSWEGDPRGRRAYDPGNRRRWGRSDDVATGSAHIQSSPQTRLLMVKTGAIRGRAAGGAGTVGVANRVSTPTVRRLLPSSFPVSSGLAAEGPSALSNMIKELNELSRQQGGNLLEEDAEADDHARMGALTQLNRTVEVVKYQADDWNCSNAPLLKVKNMHISAKEDGSKLVRGMSLTVKCGETHAILGRNGSGKSTFAKALAGHPNYEVIKGTAEFKGLDMLAMDARTRAVAGLFLAFQYPIEIESINNELFLREALNEKRLALGLEPVSPFEFSKMMAEQLGRVGLGVEFLDRPMNFGFSGGEKKRNEVLQMMMLNPDLCVLDETDSGLDVDSFRTTAEAVSEFKKTDESKKAFLIVTHYKKLLEVLKPDFCHVLHRGVVIHSGGAEVADQLEERGFQPFLAAYKTRVEEKKRQQQEEEEEQQRPQ